MVAEGQGHGLGDEGLDDVHADLAGLVGGDVDDDGLGAGPLQVGDDLLERVGAGTAAGAVGAVAAGCGPGRREGTDLIEGVDGPLPLQEEVEDVAHGQLGVGQGATDDGEVLSLDLLGARAAGVAAQGDAQGGELAVDLGQRPLRVDVAGGGHHLGQLGVDLGGLDGVEGGDAVVGGGVEQVGLQLGGGADPVVLGDLLPQGGGVDGDRGQAQALEPGQGDGVALDDLEQATQDRLAQVGVRGGAGGDGVDELLGGGAHREVEVRQHRWDEDLTAAGQGPAAHPTQGDAGV